MDYLSLAEIVPLHPIPSTYAGYVVTGLARPFYVAAPNGIYMVKRAQYMAGEGQVPSGGAPRYSLLHVHAGESLPRL